MCLQAAVDAISERDHESRPWSVVNDETSALMDISAI
jgi:hypothetical protein